MFSLCFLTMGFAFVPPDKKNSIRPSVIQFEPNLARLATCYVRVGLVQTDELETDPIEMLKNHITTSRNIESKNVSNLCADSHVFALCDESLLINLIN